MKATKGWEWQTTSCRWRRPSGSMADLQSLLKDMTSGDEVRAEKAITALVEFGEDAIPALMGLTRSPDVDTRWCAVRTLAQSPQASTEWLIPFLLTDPAPEVRQCAALGLAVRPDGSAIDPLVQALSDADS